MTHLPVRIGVPTGVPGTSEDLRGSENATGVGLLLWALHNQWTTVQISASGANAVRFWSASCAGFRISCLAERDPAWHWIDSDRGLSD